MPEARPSHYRLTPRAERDLEDIWLYSAETWSPDRADAYLNELTAVFEALVQVPEMARERAEFSPPMRLHPMGGHLIVFRLSEEYVEIVRLLGGRQDWAAILGALED